MDIITAKEAQLRTAAAKEKEKMAAVTSLAFSYDAEKVEEAILMLSEDIPEDASA